MKTVDDLENTDQGHPHRFWSPLTEELADLAICDYWLDYELLQLEAAVEDPFNVMGDNLALNGFPASMTKFSEDSGSDLKIIARDLGHT